jgi:hypothetical protein
VNQSAIGVRPIPPSAKVLGGVAWRGVHRSEAGKVRNQRRASVVDQKELRVELL